MFSFLNRFYFLFKLSTSFILLFFLILITYLFINAYLKQDGQDENNIEKLSNQVTSLTNIIKQNSNNLNSIKNLAQDNKKSVKNINENLISNQDGKNQKLQLQIKNLTIENKRLTKDLENISLEIKNLKNSDSRNKDYMNQPSQIKNIITLMKLKLKNGSDINEEIVFLNDISTNEINKSNIEKLTILANNNLYGLNKLKEDHDEISADYLNNYYLNKNKYRILKYFFNLISIHPNMNENIEDKNVLLLSLSKKNLDEENISESIKYLNTLENHEYFFSKWIIQANNYNQIIKLINNFEH